MIHLDDADIGILQTAIRDHELGLTKGNETVMTCWDADRLDVGRVRRRPNPICLCTDYARKKETIEWAYKRSRCD